MMFISNDALADEHPTVILTIIKKDVFIYYMDSDYLYKTNNVDDAIDKLIKEGYHPVAA